MSVARGIKSSGGTDFVTGFVILAAETNFDLNALVSGVNNITIADANVTAGANIDPSKIGDFADNDATFKTVAVPATRGHSDVATATGFGILTTSLPTTLEGEISTLRDFWKTGFAGIIDNTTGLPVASEWYAPVEKGVILATTGMAMPYFGTTAPTGWIIWTDGTIGSGGSGATNYAHYDARELYRMLWRMFSDTICPVTGGRGADPDADFNAAKPLRLPLASGRIPGIAGTPASANTFDTMTFFASSSADSTHITLNSLQKLLNDSIINNYTVTVTSGVRNGQTAVVSSYTAATGVIVLGAGLTGALAPNDTFTITKAVPTRAPGDLVGKPDTLALGSKSVTSAGTDTSLVGFGGGSATTMLGNTTNYPPTIFMNWIIKL